MNDSDSESNSDIQDESAVFVEERSKRKTLVAPWKNVEEFNQVYSWIYGEEANSKTKQLACRQMLVWKVRRMDLAPAAVLGTLVILEIQLKDERLRDANATHEQKSELQVLYSSAFTRFFNYMSSIMQMGNMKTMYETAKQLNLRSFVVDLRHICAHGLSMPSLEILQSTAKYCLKWLEDFYWKPQSECMRNVHTSNIRRKDQTQFEQNVMELFHFYDITLACIINGNQKFTRKYIKADKLKDIKEYATNKSVTDMSLVLDEITKDLGALLKQEKNMVDAADIYIEAILRMKYFFQLIDTHITSNESHELLIKSTLGLFRLLAINGFIEDLFQNLLAIVENKNEDASRRKAAVFWANKLVEGFIAYRKCRAMYKREKDQDSSISVDLASLNFDNTSRKLLQFYGKEGFNVKQLLIFGGTGRRPWVWTFDRDFLAERINCLNKYSVDVLKNLLPLVVPELTQTEVDTLKQLFDLKIKNETTEDEGDVTIEEPMEDDKVYTVDDVKAYNGRFDFDSTVAMDCEEGVKKYGVWSTVPDCQDWYACPIGSLIWD